MNNIYKEELMDHYQKPRNYGKLKNATHTTKVINSSCGDELELDLKIENGIIKEIGFISTGCVLSTASASIFSEFLKGKKVKDVKKMTEEEIFEILNLKPSPARTKCVLITLEAVKKI